MWQNVRIFWLKISPLWPICTFSLTEHFFFTKMSSFCKRSSTFLLSPLRCSISFIDEKSQRLGSEVEQMPGDCILKNSWEHRLDLKRPGIEIMIIAGGGQTFHWSYHHVLVTIWLSRDASSAVSSLVLWLPYSWVALLEKSFTRLEDETTKFFNTQYRWV